MQPNPSIYAAIYSYSGIDGNCWAASHVHVSLVLTNIQSSKTSRDFDFDITHFKWTLALLITNEITDKNNIFTFNIEKQNNNQHIYTIFPEFIN